MVNLFLESLSKRFKHFRKEIACQIGFLNLCVANKEAINTQTIERE